MMMMCSLWIVTMMTMIWHNFSRHVDYGDRVTIGDNHLAILKKKNKILTTVRVRACVKMLDKGKLSYYIFVVMGLCPVYSRTTLYRDCLLYYLC